MLGLAQPQFLGLNATFGCHTQDTPDVVVCDFASPGCHDFARHVGASLVLNVPDAMSTINFVTADPTTPPFSHAITWPVITTGVLEEDAQGQYEASVRGTLLRAVVRAFTLLFQAYFASLGRAQALDWRPSDLPT